MNDFSKLLCSLLALSFTAISLSACENHAPSTEQLERLDEELELNRQIFELLNDSSAFVEIPCTRGMDVWRMNWRMLCESIGFESCEDDWVSQLGTASYYDPPGLYGLDYYAVDPPNEVRTRDLERALAQREAAEWIRVVRITEFDHGSQIDTRHFSPGYLEGWIVTLSRQGPEIACAERFHIGHGSHVSEGRIEQDLVDRLRFYLRNW